MKPREIKRRGRIEEGGGRREKLREERRGRREKLREEGGERS